MGELIWIARAIILFIILRILLRALFSSGRRGPSDSAQGRTQAKPSERVGGELVRDPQCNTYVPKNRAIVVTRNGETLYFCSAKCRDEYGH